uniref:p53 and DNA damage-regulated protein 1-like n=1 Tax=Styela clava TaxID=7725 RepID=UPI001939A6B5|nr:p53 and DNA damage-regulated protein 1-like [Styela clava]
MARNADSVLKYLTEVEEQAEDILSDKQQIVDLDKRRNMNREALRAIKNGVAAPNKSKTWLNFGGMFIKLPSSAATDMLTTDQHYLDEEINSVRTKLHDKINKMRDVEGQSDLKGFDLNALSKTELEGLQKSRLL